MIKCHYKHLEQRCLERSYKLADVMDCVIKQEGDQWIIDPDHKSYPHQYKKNNRNFKISVIIPSRQEGEEVLLTCESFLKAGVDEVIVVDDASVDGSCNNLPEEVLVVRNNEFMGVGRARNQ